MGTFNQICHTLKQPDNILYTTDEAGNKIEQVFTKAREAIKSRILQD
jgi:hypothetical protein